MSHLLSEKKVYYYTLEGSRCVFADERVKKHLLDVIGELHQRDGWLLFAFCITDDSAYFIIGANRISEVARTLQQAVRKQLKQSSGQKSHQKSGNELIEQKRKLNTLTEIASFSREIHKIPLRRGYVGRLEDYWWSSYPAYVGIHCWDLVDRRMLFLYFSADPNTARRRLKQFHTLDDDTFQYIND
ncbi:MAG: hypothetical protein LUG99_11315 [Lachnospiraceae bacterium]|nr:hypothetical protein [Lachnospiraceae bacterium]